MQKAKTIFINIILLYTLVLSSSHGQIIRLENKWSPGQQINILFMNGNSEEKRLFKRATNIWAKYVNLEFKFNTLIKHNVELDPAFRTNTIRVKFNKDEGNFSPLGNRFNIKHSDRISYLNIKESPGQKIRFVSKASHELGHALGLMHEHQHPEVNFYRNEEEMLQICRYIFMLDINNPVEMNVCKTNLSGISYEEAEQNGIRVSDFDQQSIMLYTDLANTNKGFFDTRISLTDKDFIAREYPHRRSLSIEEIETMHRADNREEINWALKEYDQGDCSLVSEGNNLYLKKQSESNQIKVKVSAMSLIDNYFTACIRSLE